VSDLGPTVRKFARHLRREFALEIGQNSGAFKRRVVGFLKSALPPGPGRPRSEAVTRATEMLAQGKTWQQVYGECLPPIVGGSDSRQLTQYRLRCAVRSRRNAHRRRKSLVNSSAKKL
jgi:hypothetical protein